MRTSIRRASAIIVALGIVAVVRCTGPQVTGGTGSETVIGKIINEDGTPAAKTEVLLHPFDFDPAADTVPGEIGSDTTGSDGSYAITLAALPANRYTLQAVNLLLRTRAIVPDVVIAPSGESTHVATASLYRTGSIRVVFPDSLATENGYAYIPGTSFHAYLENGIALIDSVPAQMITSVNYHEENNTLGAQRIAGNVAIKEGVRAIVTLSGSAYNAKLMLNTTSAGVDVAEPVYNFPLLVRLTAANFNFNEAQADGSDIRFTKPDNTPLPFEIERWDPVAGLAEVWVGVDTVSGNDDRQFITAYWGEPAKVIPRVNAIVFDTASGFRGVWHLAEEAGGIGTTGLFRDATGKHNGSDFISATDRSGIIGYGHAFDGVDDYIPVNSPVTNFFKGDLTIALWVNLGDSGGTILSKLDTVPKWNLGEASLYFGDGTDFDSLPGVNGARPSFVGFSNDYAIAGASVGPAQWHFLVFTRKWNGDSTGISRYFIDGEEVPLSRDSLAIRSDETPGATIMIGKPNNNESYAYFKGLMDELEISAVARSAGWIKLAYMNQREDNLLVQFYAPK